ncbi:MAG: RHS repeat-associated core domain-containing protein [bacterium]
MKNEGNRALTGMLSDVISDGRRILDRGYCGHEHLLEHNIINMNGRIYDPTVGQFMQADNYVQTPEDYIGYNRYSYCRHNPFKYVDPSGEQYIAGSGGGGVMAAMGAYYLAMEAQRSTAIGEALGEAMRNWNPNARIEEADAARNRAERSGVSAGSSGGGGATPPAENKDTKADGDTETNGVSGEQETGTDGTGKVQGPAEKGKVAPWEMLPPDEMQELKDGPARETEFDGNEEVQIGDATPVNRDNKYAFWDNLFAYNCHSYAWHNGNGDLSDSHNSFWYMRWDGYPLDDAREMARPLQGSEGVQVGDRIIYFDGEGNPLHSAIVSGVNEYGLATRVTSKWGSDPLYNHHPLDPDVVPGYGTYLKYYRMNNGGR